jgi:hypothetical protein
LLLKVIDKLRNELPAQTVGELARALLAKNMAKISKGICSPAEVWDGLCRIIADQLGVDASKLTPETNFVEDLNVG